MHIVIGSHNKTKINAVQHVFEHATITLEAVPSGVSSQPIGDEETREGALNRAHAARIQHPNSIGIGLEGGVMYVSGELYLCNWGALETLTGKVFTASGARIRLPEHFAAELNLGVELSDIMDTYTEKNDIRNHEGAIGIFTNHAIDRSAMFTHVVQLLKGQYEFAAYA